MQIKHAVEQLVASIPIPEEQLEQLYKEQYTRERKSVFLNMLFFFIGMSLLLIGVYKTYLFTSQPDPNGAVRKMLNIKSEVP